MKSYKDFLLERAFSSIGQAAREQMKKQNGLNAARNAADRQQKAAKVGVTPPSQQKALPPGKSSPKSPADIGAELLKRRAGKGGALAKQDADKGSALAVRPKPGTDGPGETAARKPNPYRTGEDKSEDKKRRDRCLPWQMRDGSGKCVNKKRKKPDFIKTKKIEPSDAPIDKLDVKSYN
jgi:hypothetical protein